MFPQTRALTILFLCTSFLATADDARAVVPTRTVTLSGQEPPGTSAGVSFLNFGPPAIDASGRTAFLANLTGPAVSSANNSGLWSEGSGSLALVARAGNAAPGTAGDANFSNFNSFVLNGAGRTAFSSSLAGAGVVLNTNDTGLWSDGSGSLALVAQAGNAALGTA